MDYDVFNGDADGICALIQLRLAEPRPDATLVTGVKRDIQLLGRIPYEGVDRVTALDISFDKNREDVNRLLNAGADVFFCDALPATPNENANNAGEFRFSMLSVPAESSKVFAPENSMLFAKSTRLIDVATPKLLPEPSLAKAAAVPNDWLRMLAVLFSARIASLDVALVVNSFDVSPISMC